MQQTVGIGVAGRSCKRCAAAKRQLAARERSHQTPAAAGLILHAEDKSVAGKRQRGAGLRRRSAVVSIEQLEDPSLG